MKEIEIEVIELKKFFKCVVEFKNNRFVISHNPLHLTSWGDSEENAIDQMQNLLYQEFSFEDEDWEDFSMGTPKFRG